MLPADRQPGPHSQLYPLSLLFPQKKHDNKNNRNNFLGCTRCSSCRYKNKHDNKNNRNNLLGCTRCSSCRYIKKHDNKNNRDNFLGCTRCSSCRYIKKHDNKNNRDNMLHGIRCPCCPCCRQNYSAFHSYGLPAVRRTFSPAALPSCRRAYKLIIQARLHPV